MGPAAFINLCERVRATGLVKDAFRSTVEEQVAKFLHIIGHNVKNRSVSFFFHRSGETVSRHFHNVWKMNRGKSVVPDSSTTVREFMKWTDDMDFRLLIAMLDEARLDNRVDGSWTTQAYNNIVEALRQTRLTGITKNNVKNRQKSLKDRWQEVHDLFSGLSGFAWDESTKQFTAEPEVWDDLLQAKPAAAKWRVSSIRYYDLMEELWGVDRATGHMARTARQARRNIAFASRTSTFFFNRNLLPINPYRPMSQSTAIPKKQLRVRDHGYDNYMEVEKKTRKVLKIQALILSQPTQSLPMKLAELVLLSPRKAKVDRELVGYRRSRFEDEMGQVTRAYVEDACEDFKGEDGVGQDGDEEDDLTSDIGSDVDLGDDDDDDCVDTVSSQRTS
uniref:Uncharacterized protein n=1 Tax=Cajanus cajan TaxID=3821 RepID=A0A151T4P0_CAJCA|nr:hypothetical protein KK1_016518 [Cajanus cajan]